MATFSWIRCCSCSCCVLMASAHDRATQLQKELDEIREDPVLPGHQALLERVVRGLSSLVS